MGKKGTKSHLSFRGQRYKVQGAQKENALLTTPNSGRRRRPLLRSATVRQSFREAVGSIREKFHQSTRKLRLKEKELPGDVPRRSKRLAGCTPPRHRRDVKLYSPFHIETPKRMENQRNWCDTETPTRLRREVEALTADMRALAALTPTSLKNRATTRRASLTNGSLLQRQQMRRRVETTIH